MEMKKKQKVAVQNSDLLVAELRQLIDAARHRVASSANAELTMLYWRISSRVRTEILQNERAEYGEQIVATVSPLLTAEYGKGFARSNLQRMMQFAEFLLMNKFVRHCRTNCPDAISSKFYPSKMTWHGNITLRCVALSD